jgi:DNA-directed RNA polymerase specialized sigma subunit
LGLKLKYTKEITDKLIADYLAEIPVEEIAAELDVQPRSVIAKLSSLGVYKKKEYRTKRGEIPVKKEEYIERIANLLDVSVDILESLEKVNKSVLALLEKTLLEAKVEQPANMWTPQNE